mgnify:CR=1 FL=1
MSRLKRVIFSVLQKRYSDDLYYLEDKKDFIATMDTLSTILWMNNLDPSIVEAIATQYEICHEDFCIMLKALKKIEG